MAYIVAASRNAEPGNYILYKDSVYDHSRVLLYPSDTKP